MLRYARLNIFITENRQEDRYGLAGSLGVTRLTVGSRVTTNDAKSKGYEHCQENKKHWKQKIFLKIKKIKRFTGQL